jgi:uncharacterized membrane protein
MRYLNYVGLTKKNFMMFIKDIKIVQKPITVFKKIEIDQEKEIKK